MSKINFYEELKIKTKEEELCTEVNVQLRQSSLRYAYLIKIIKMAVMFDDINCHV